MASNRAHNSSFSINGGVTKSWTEGRQGPAAGAMMGRLTTHVLDQAAGKPAAGLRIEVWRLDGAQHLLKTVTTNADGRCNGALLEGEALTAGRYELRFHAGDYLRSSGVKLPDPAFLDVIPIQFGIADPSAHYHVPLLLSPYGYSTYRGS
jgi:5-hydroxyisourate hydrolase